MNWGLIALGGKTGSVERLSAQLERYLCDDPLSLVVGVDGGCTLLERLSITPDIILGDFDSIGDLDMYRERWPNAAVKTFPVDKDYTDAELAFEVMDAHDIDRIMIIGGFGGRADHMVSVLHMLLSASNRVMIDEQNYVEKIQAPYKRVVEKNEKQREYVSLIPTGGRFTGITLSGFKYPLNDAVIDFAQTVGISNEVVDTIGTIEIESGEGYLILSSD